MKTEHPKPAHPPQQTAPRLLVALAVSLLAPVCWATDGDFPRPVSEPLSTSFRILAEGKPLREAIADLSQRTGLPVWLDRRVDPSRPLTAAAYGPTARDALERWASENGLQMGTADEVVLLGPSPAPEWAATEMMAAWDSLVASNPPGQTRSASPLTASRPIRWPMLTTPQEALQIVGDSWDLQTEGVSLPHDLWPQVDLGEVRVTTALGLIGVGFGLALELDPATRQVTARPLREPTPVNREYPRRTIPPPLRSELTATALGGQLRKREDRWALSGPARAHALLEAQLVEAQLVESRHPPQIAAGRPAPSPQKRYSLRLINTPAVEVLQSLCRSAGWQLEIGPQAVEPLGERIDLQVEQATLEELVERVVAPLGLRVERDGERLRVSTGR